MPLLTDLPDGLSFERRLVEAMIESHRTRSVLAVVLVSIDSLNAVNATLGRAYSDMLMQEVSYRMSQCLREGDAVARIGGDEFAFMLPGIAQVGDDHLDVVRRIHVRAHDILDAIIPAFSLGGQQIFLSASGGISLYPYDGASAHLLLKNVSAAVLRAKDHGTNKCQFYTEEMDAAGQKRIALESGLRRAMSNGELLVYYQPKVSASTGEIVGAEALVRWQHPEHGLLPPSEFIPFAEESGLIAPLSELVLRDVCTQSVTWQNEGLRPVRVSVNLSPRHFQQTDIVPQIARVLRDTGLSPKYLELEVTEGTIMRDAERASMKLRELKGSGVTISVDDFGTGYSSLGYLRVLPIDTLKIDKTFVREMATNADDEAIVSAIIGLAHTLRLKVVAEGVETEDQAKLLRALRCDELQGYLFAYPQPGTAFRRLLVGN
jgi:diguanylate cyclase (GGDEF)-like protein